VQVWFHHRRPEANVLAPFFLIVGIYPQTVDNTFLNVMMPLKGDPPNPLTNAVQIGMTLLAFLAIGTALVGILGRIPVSRNAQETRNTLPWRSLLVLTVPLLLAYMVLLYPRGLSMVPPDRYVLGFLPFATILLLRLRFGQSRPQFGWLALASLGVVAFYSITTNHDAFATFRASWRAIAEVQAAGVSREAIDGGFEYNADTQVLDAGIIGAPPPGTHTAERGPCGALFPLFTPAAQPKYALAWPSSPCPRVTRFAPVSYSTWLPPFRRDILIVEAQPKQWIPIPNTP
jgi:hypothetical protein